MAATILCIYTFRVVYNTRVDYTTHECVCVKESSLSP